VSFERYTDKITAGTKVETTAGPPIIEQQLTSDAVETIETASRDPGSHLRRAAEDAGKHVVALDRALEDELTRSIESRGRCIPPSGQGSRTNGPLPIDDTVPHDARGSRRASAPRSIML